MLFFILYQMSRAYCYTVNNYSPEDEKLLQDLVVDNSGHPIKDHWYGREIGDEKQTPHLQGYIRFNDKKAFSRVQHMLPRGAHIESAKGSPSDNWEYCWKQLDGVLICGTKPKLLAKRKHAEVDHDALLLEVSGPLNPMENPAIPSKLKLFKSRDLLFAHSALAAAPDDLPDVCGFWFWGPAGTGKSHRAREQFASYGVHTKSHNKWWDGYRVDRHRAVLYDDATVFDIKHSGFGSSVLTWADKYSFTAEIKGSSLQIRPLAFIVTSNFSIEQLFGDAGYAPEQVQPILERFQQIHVPTLPPGVAGRGSQRLFLTDAAVLPDPSLSADGIEEGPVPEPAEAGPVGRVLPRFIVPPPPLGVPAPIVIDDSETDEE